jgi:glycerol-3-phosphate acyltransferase PlsY
MAFIWFLGPVVFLMGAIPFGYVIGRARGIDIRTVGSGNIGAANVSRSLGWRYGSLVLCLDALKVAVPTVFVWWLTGSQPLATLAASFGMLGHVFSPFVGWKGGKGVACLLGAALVLYPAAAGLCLGLFVVTVAVTRYASLGSVVAAVAHPIVLALLQASKPLVCFGVFAAGLVVYTHWANIVRLRRGTEPRLGRSVPSERS